MKHRATLPARRAYRCKPRKPSGFMATLTTAQRATLFQWLTKDHGLTYAAAQARIFKEWGIRTNGKALSNFWRSFCAPRLIKAAPADPGGNFLLVIVVQVRTKKGEG